MRWCLNGHAPQYLIDECRLAGGGRRSGTHSALRQMLKSPIRHLATVDSVQRLHNSLEQFTDSVWDFTLCENTFAKHLVIPHYLGRGAFDF